MFNLRLLVLITLVANASCQEAELIESSPDLRRFEVKTLAANLNEPMELDFLPDGSILLIERPGWVKLYDPQTEIIQVCGEIPVHHHSENGLLGLAIDPDFEINNWIYLFYTDPVRKAYQHVSRFVFDGDSIHLQSEKRLLEFYIDWENCCHFGGALDFGPDGLLYISTGDNTGGTDSAPIDERDGHSMGDAQRTSSNTRDLRGKILRIKPEPDGNYSIPEGNLFAPGDTLGLPEIYVMGVRNPWKMKVDPGTGWLYWGEVGPNPGLAIPERGPVSYEEINQAREAGNFGWPYIIADNKPYRDFDYNTGEIGPNYDPKNLINNSPNNTGYQELPPARKALIWYPNLQSDSFPLTGEGGGSVVVGPVYHHPGRHHTTALPHYYDKMLFMGEWMRSWLRAVRLGEDGKFQSMESFLPDSTFRKPIDLTFGPDGCLYVLDYGSNWYVHNRDAKLTRISYNQGNRAPTAKARVSPLQAAVPAIISCDASDSEDADGDSLSYRWEVLDLDEQYKGTGTSFSMENPGDYQVVLHVTDAHGLTDSDTANLLLGNAPPQILATLDNYSFYEPGTTIEYDLQVQDAEDGSSVEGSIPSDALEVDIRFLSEGTDLNMLRKSSVFRDPYIDFLEGKKLLESSDCLACHHVSDTSIGPSLEAIAKRYKDNPDIKPYLSLKIAEGGIGVWGDKWMSAHPQHSPTEIEQMADYILSLNGQPRYSPGSNSGVLDIPPLEEDYLLISSRYLDQGSDEADPIETLKQIVLRPYLLHATRHDLAYRVVPKPYNDMGGMFAEIALNGSYIGWRQIDLNGIQSLRLRMRSGAKHLRVEVRQQSPQGRIIGKKEIEVQQVENYWDMKEDDWFWDEVEIQPSDEIEDLFLIFYSDRTEGMLIYYEICQLEWVEFRKKSQL